MKKIRKKIHLLLSRYIVYAFCASGLVLSGNPDSLNISYQNYYNGKVYTTQDYTNDFKSPIYFGNLGDGNQTVVNEPEDSSYKRLKIRFNKGEFGNANLNAGSRIQNKNSYTLEYRVKFDDDWQFVLGGKLPGLSGGVSPSGGTPSTDGMTSRIMWRRDNNWNGSYSAPYVKDYLELYHYWRGQALAYNNGYGDTDRKFGDQTYLEDAEKNTWYILKMKVTLGTGNSDGRTEVWVNGVKKHDSRYRYLDPGDNWSLNRIMFNFFYGGAGPSWTPNDDTHLFFDNLVLSQQGSQPPSEPQPRDAVAISNLPASMPASGKLNVRVNYTANQSKNLLVAVFDANWDYKGSTWAKVNGAGSANVSVDYDEVTTGEANLIVRLTPQEGVWANSTASSYPVVPIATPVADDELSLVNLPATLPESGSQTFRVQYIANENKNLLVSVFDANWKYKGSSWRRVNGSGAVSVQVDYDRVGTANAILLVRLTKAQGIWNDFSADAVSEVPIEVPVPDKVSVTNLPSSISPSGSQVFRVQYVANEAKNLLVSVFDANWKYKGDSWRSVSGSGTVDIPVSYDRVGTTSANLLVRLTRAQGDWGDSTADGYYSVAVQAPAKDSVSFAVAPNNISNSGSHTFRVNYTANKNKNLLVAVLDNNWNYKGHAWVSVSGSGSANVKVNYRSIGTGQARLIMRLTPVNTSWGNSSAENLSSVRVSR